MFDKMIFPNTSVVYSANEDSLSFIITFINGAGFYLLSSNFKRTVSELVFSNISVSFK